MSYTTLYGKKNQISRKFNRRDGQMTEALSKISRTAETGKKVYRNSPSKQGKTGIWKHLVNDDDRVDISDEAKARSGGKKKRNDLLAYLENID